MSERARLTLISHAPTSAVRRAAFPCDESIEEAARKRIADMNWDTGRAQRVFCGPEKRTQETAMALGLSAIVDPALRDCAYGRWAGRDLSELQLEHPDEVTLWLSTPDAAPHGGESIHNLIIRVAGWLAEQAKEPGNTIAITHPAVIRTAIVSILEAPAQAFWRVDVPPLTATDLRFNGRSWSLRSTAVTVYPPEIKARA
jgi:broad specificity phosphatase PhoE